jgi:hypothetical protein
MGILTKSSAFCSQALDKPFASEPKIKAIFSFKLYLKIFLLAPKLVAKDLIFFLFRYLIVSSWLNDITGTEKTEPVLDLMVIMV